MAPKAAKGSAKKPETATGNKNWEAALTSQQFEEDSWKACVSLVVETCPEDETLIQALALAVQKPLRKLFTVLTWDDTEAKIHEFGNPKNKKRDNVPMYSEVTEPAKSLLDAGEEIPCDLLAKLVKFQLLQIKSNDLQRRKAEQAKPVEEKATAVPRSAGKEKGGGKDKKAKPPSPVPEKNTKLKRRDDVDPPDYIDDEPDDGPQHYILILGFHHPHLPGALESMGVQISNVIKLLHQTKPGELNTKHNKESENTSVNKNTDEDEDHMKKLVARTKRLDHFWSGLRPHLDNAPPELRLNDVAELKYTVNNLLVNKDDLEAMLSFGSGIFEGIACLLYDTLDWRRQHQHYLNNLKIIDVPRFSAPDPQQPVVSSAVSRSKKKPGREGSQTVQENKITTDVDMSHYNKLLNTLASEACSVPLMLHCMLEQVVFSSDQLPPVSPDEAEEPRDYTDPYLDQQLVNSMFQSFLPLLHAERERSRLLNGLLARLPTKEDKKRLFEKFGKDEKQSGDPLVVKHQDERALRLRNNRAVEGLDVAEIEMMMMKMSPVFDIIQSVSQHRSASCWMAIKQQLQYYCANDMVPWSDVERLFHESVFESMPLTRLDCGGVLHKTTEPFNSLVQSAQHSPSTLPWDDPLTYAKHQLWHLHNKGPTFLTEDPSNTEKNNKVSIHLELSDIQSHRQRSLFDWHYTEHYNATTFPQVLQLASEEYRCLDTFRGSTNNILYIYCHNPMNHRRQCKTSWDIALHTTIKFRKYLENVADKISDWIRQEEAKREAKTIKHHVNPIETPKVETPVETTPELEQVIRRESLKAWKLEQDRLKEEELAKKTKKEAAPKGKPAKDDAAAKDEAKKGQDKAPQSAKKGRADTASSLKSVAESMKVELNKEDDTTEEEFNGFIGYNMDGKLIHVSGKLQYLYPSDGGCIIVETSSYMEGSNLLKVAVKKDGHHFYTHINHIIEELPSVVSSQTQLKVENKMSAGITKVKQGSLTAVLDNGIHLSYSFYGPTGQYIENPQENATSKMETQHPTNSPTEPADNKACEKSPVPHSCPFNSLSLSVPNGLLLQFQREDTQVVPPEELGMLVRQSFPLHGKGDLEEIPDPSLIKEVSRLVTSQGAVVRNMRDGSTVVLFADGSVSFSQDSGPVWVSHSKNTTRDDRKEQSTAHNAETERGFWSTTTPSGARICTVGTTHKSLPTPPLLVFKATDPMTQEVMLTREDGVVSVQNPNGSITVEHADGTRITSLYEDSLLIHTGERPESITLKSSSAACFSATRCAQGLDETSAEDTNNSHTVSTYLECGHDQRQTTIYENSEASVSGSRQSSDSSECVPTKEKVVLVEKEGCATVVMYPDRHMAHVFLADGTVITGNNRGAYQVFPSSAGLLQIQCDGKCVYISDPLDTPSPKQDNNMNQERTYSMSHCETVACEVTDPDGNHFQVMEDGTVSVVNLSPDSSKHGKEDEEEEDTEMDISIVKYSEHSPRLFIVHENGSGTELLHSHMVEELLFQAYSDPTIAIMKEPLPDTEDEFGITILKPYPESVWSQWLLAKQKPDITPPNLRNRSWTDFPRAEKPTPGPPFGTDLGRCLTLTPRSGASVSHSPPVRSCPKVLLMTELYQHRPFTSLLKNHLDTQLKAYIESLMEKEQHSEHMKIKDPRSHKETAHANDLLNLVLSFAEDDDSHSSEKKMSDISSLYIHAVGAPVESDASEDTSTPATESFPIRKDSKLTGRLAQYRQEMCEEKACIEALRKQTVVPYFHIENLPLYESLLHQEITKVPVSHGSKVQDRQERVKKIPSPILHKPAFSQSTIPSAVRMPAKSFSISPPRADVERDLKASTVQSKSVYLDVTGQPRKSRVRLPTCIQTTKPCGVPNYEFQTIEEPVRRKCRTISLTNPNLTMRGFHLHPLRVNFGTVQEGTTSSVTVVMKNVGVDMSRFKVKQPPPSTGLRVVYNPGPVAAGLHVELRVQLIALSTVRVGEAEAKRSLSHDIMIHTETEILYLPVSATILSERLYDIWIQDHTSGHSKISSTFRHSETGAIPASNQPGHLNNRISL